MSDQKNRPERRKCGNQGGPAGELTVFAALSFMLIAQFLFVLLSLACYREENKLAAMNTDAMGESLFSQYCIPLWENYRILAYDAEEREDFEDGVCRALMEEGGENLDWKYLQMPLTEVNLQDCILLTDGDGKAVRESIISYMKENLIPEAIEQICETYSAEDQNNGQTGEGDVEYAIECMEQKKSSSADANAESADHGENAGNGAENSSDSKVEGDLTGKEILQAVKECRNRGILGLILPKGKELSEDSLSDLYSDEKLPSERQLLTGDKSFEEEQGVYEEALLEDYFLTYLSNYDDPLEDRALQYEAEYLIGGKSSDTDNLKAVANRMILIREGSNMAYLLADAKSQEELSLMAASLSAALCIPEFEPALKLGLMAAWAYCESILDLRRLLDGGKIPASKNESTWTSSLREIPALLTGSPMAIEDENGIDYKTALGILLLAQKDAEKEQRLLNLCEATVKKQNGYESFEIDRCMVEMDFCASYAYTAQFLDLAGQLSNQTGLLTCQKNGSVSYWKKED